MKKVFLFLLNIFFSPLWAAEHPRPLTLISEERLTDTQLSERYPDSKMLLVHVLYNATSESFTIPLVENEELAADSQKKYYIYSSDLTLFSKLNLKVIKSYIGQHSTCTYSYSTDPKDKALLRQKIKKNPNISHYLSTRIEEKPTIQSTYCCFEKLSCLVRTEVAHTEEKYYEKDYSSSQNQPLTTVAQETSLLAATALTKISQV